MDNQLLAFIIFSVTSLLVGVACHYFIRTYFFAAVVATVIVVIVIQVISYLQLGYLDPFYKIAMVTSGAMAIVVSLVIGLPFLRARKKNA